MSATYRIDVEHDPTQNAGMKWRAKIYRLAGDAYQASEWADSPQEATGRAQSWVARMMEQQSGFTVYVDDEGKTVEHSVKA